MQPTTVNVTWFGMEESLPGATFESVQEWVTLLDALPDAAQQFKVEQVKLRGDKMGYERMGYMTAEKAKAWILGAAAKSQYDPEIVSLEVCCPPPNGLAYMAWVGDEVYLLTHCSPQEMEAWEADANI